MKILVGKTRYTLDDYIEGYDEALALLKLFKIRDERGNCYDDEFMVKEDGKPDAELLEYRDQARLGNKRAAYLLMSQVQNWDGEWWEFTEVEKLK